MLKWWALTLTIFGTALGWLGSLQGLQNLTQIYLGVFFVFVSVIVWLVVLVKWLMKP